MPDDSSLSLEAVNALSSDDFIARFGPVFEHSPWVAAEAGKWRPFASLEALRKVMTGVVAASSPERQMALIQAHPDLAGRLARRGQLTRESTREQAGAGLAAADAVARAQIEALNAAYRSRFNFPFIVCARLNNVETIIAAMKLRLENSREQEIEAALHEIDKIARLRINDLLAD